MAGKIGRPKVEKFTKIVSLRLGFEDYRMLLRLKKCNTETISDVIRRLIREKYSNSCNM